MNKDTIQVGDIVNVYFNTAEAIYSAKILYIPFETGEYFKLKDSDSRLYNVHNNINITLMCDTCEKYYNFQGSIEKMSITISLDPESMKEE